MNCSVHANQMIQHPIVTNERPLFLLRPLIGVRKRDLNRSSSTFVNTRIAPPVKHIDSNCSQKRTCICADSHGTREPSELN